MNAGSQSVGRDIRQGTPCTCDNAGSLAREKGFSGWVGIIKRLRAAVNFAVPVGYEDETGFHYGTKSAR